MMKEILIWFINKYQSLPLNSHMKCRFIPTCSEYTKLSIERFGAFKGSIMGIKRILRCHPFGKSGIDMVPIKEKK